MCHNFIETAYNSSSNIIYTQKMFFHENYCSFIEFKYIQIDFKHLTLYRGL